MYQRCRANTRSTREHWTYRKNLSKNTWRTLNGTRSSTLVRPPCTFLLLFTLEKYAVHKCTCNPNVLMLLKCFGVITGFLGVPTFHKRTILNCFMASIPAFFFYLASLHAYARLSQALPPPMHANNRCNHYQLPFAWPLCILTTYRFSAILLDSMSNVFTSFMTSGTRTVPVLEGAGMMGITRVFSSSSVNSTAC